jgi:glycosyltransferase involved in cell wall biosynthesis
MKIVLLPGSYPPDICGVSEYTARLVESLEKAGATIEVFTGKNWALANSLRLGHELAALGADVLHMQYPTTGYGKNLGPQALSLLWPFVMTIHECSQAHVLRRLALYPFSLRARKVIFTNEFEQRYCHRFAPWIKSKSVVIPIGSGIPLASGIVRRQPNVVTYFGLIRPQKGLEQVIELARLFKQRANGLSVRILGTIMPGYEDYYARLRTDAVDLPITWQLDLDEGTLSHALAEVEVAYLPFPDGASERRSSLIALLANKTAVITTRGFHTPLTLEKAIQIATSPAEAVVLAEELFHNPEEMEHKQRNAAEYCSKFSWDMIAAEHMAIYKQLIEGKA